MSAPLRIGLVGCGRLAELGYLPALRRARGVTLAAVADPDAGRGAHLAGDLPAHDGAPALIAAGGVDALVIASPAHAHLGDARAAAAAGVPALVEKPPAPDGPSAAALAALDPAPRVGFNRRFDRGLARLRDAIGGEAVDLDLELRYRRAAWRPHAVADDALLDLGPHLVDLATWLAGAPVERVEDVAVEPTRARFALEFADGRGRARLACAIDRRHAERVVVRDAAERRVGAVRRGGVRGLLADRLRSDHPLADSLTVQLEAFAAHVRGEPAGDALGTAAEGAAVMAVIDAVRAVAGATGHPTTIAEEAA